MPSLDVHPIPRWLNEQFLHRLLTKLKCNKEFKINSSQVTVLSNSADPFASPIFRVSLTTSGRFDQFASEKTESFVLKVPAHQRSGGSDEADPLTLFENEIRFYSLTLEEMQRSLKESDASVELGPRVIHYAFGADAVLVLEDLNADGYLPIEKPLALDATISTVFKLAKWHAASIHVSSENPAQLVQHGAGIFNAQQHRDRLTFMYDNFVHFVADIRTWDVCEVYARKFAALVPQFLERGRAIFATRPAGGINVLNHGDLSLGNILQRNDAERGLNVKFVDYQYCVWATPAIDLFYVLHLVCSPDVRSVRRQELIQFYYAELRRTLDKMGFLGVPPTLLQLQSELLHNGFLEVIITTCLLPFTEAGTGEKCGDLNAGNLLAVRRSVYENEHYRSLVKAQLPQFLHKGFLN